MVLTVEQVSFSYPDGTHALSEVCFALEQGQTLGLCGANGAGKSTLLSLLCGLVPPTCGTISLQGQYITQKDISLLQRNMGFLMQNAQDQVFCPTVLQDVCFGPANLGLNEQVVIQRAEQLLSCFGLWHLKDKPPFHLSGGQLRLVALCGVLAMQPQILLLDEPTAGLDPKARRQLIFTLQSLPQSKIIAGHDLDMMMDLCDHVLILEHGRVAAYGTPDVLLTDAAALRQWDLELPLTLQGCPKCGGVRV